MLLKGKENHKNLNFKKSTGEWRNKLWCLHTMEYNSAIKRKLLTHATTCMCPKDITRAKEHRHERVRVSCRIPRLQNPKAGKRHLWWQSYESHYFSNQKIQSHYFFLPGTDWQGTWGDLRGPGNVPDLWLVGGMCGQSPGDTHFIICNCKAIKISPNIFFPQSDRKEIVPIQPGSSTCSHKRVPSPDS